MNYTNNHHANGGQGAPSGFNNQQQGHNGGYPQGGHPYGSQYTAQQIAALQREHALRNARREPLPLGFVGSTDTTFMGEHYRQFVLARQNTPAGITFAQQEVIQPPVQAYNMHLAPHYGITPYEIYQAQIQQQARMLEEQRLNEYLAAQALLEQYMAAGNHLHRAQAHAAIQEAQAVVQAAGPQAAQVAAAAAANPEPATPIASPIPVTNLECALYNSIIEVLNISFPKTLTKSHDLNSTVRRLNPILFELVLKTRKIDVVRLFPTGSEIFNVGPALKPPFAKIIPILTRTWYRYLYPRIIAYISKRDLGSSMTRPKSVLKTERILTELRILCEELDLFAKRLHSWRGHIRKIAFENHLTNGIYAPVFVKDPAILVGLGAPRLKGRWVKLDGLLAEILSGIFICRDKAVKATVPEEIVEKDHFARDEEIWAVGQKQDVEAEAIHHLVQADVDLVDAPAFGDNFIEMSAADVEAVILTGGFQKVSAIEIQLSDIEDSEDSDNEMAVDAGEGSFNGLKRHIDEISN